MPLDTGLPILFLLAVLAYVYITFQDLARRAADLAKDGLKGSMFFPRGTILAWYSAEAPVPEGWALCDGTHDTPNLINAYIQGSSERAPLRGCVEQQGPVYPTVSIPSWTFNTKAAGDHDHRTIKGESYKRKVQGDGGFGVLDVNGIEPEEGGYRTGMGGSHSHEVETSVPIVEVTGELAPRHVPLRYIMKI